MAATHLNAETVASVVEKLSKEEGLPDVHQNPIVFIRELYLKWRGKGGKVAGKPRHSVRHLGVLLDKQGTPVRSLQPKLSSGSTTNPRPEDADALTKLFLSHWDLPDVAEDAETASKIEEDPKKFYQPRLKEDEIREVANYVMKQVADTEDLDKRSSAQTAHFRTGEATSELIVRQFANSKALISVSAEQTLIVTDPRRALIGFRDLINRLWSSDKNSDEDKILLWILDLGRQDFDDEDARMKFLNVESLISRFKALKLFKEPDTAARWSWLKSRAIIMLHDTHRTETEGAVLPRFGAHHVMISAVPDQWLGSTNFRALYGRDFDKLTERNYSVFLDNSSDSTYNINYYGHAQFPIDMKAKEYKEARGLELPSPGRNYDDAMATAYIASMHSLGLGEKNGISDKEGVSAVEQLRHLGFLILNPEELIYHGAE